jgi:hypothetical protein
MVLHLLFGAASQRFALPALGRGRRSRPARKMTRRRKLLGMCAESPASGARFVGQPACLPKPLLKETTPQTCLDFTLTRIVPRI